MLQELRIHNFALIERAEIAPGAGFNVLTGETGAGKSILISALGLLLGNRASSDSVGRGAAKALVEGAFDLQDSPRARQFLEENGLPHEENILIVAREIDAGGKSKIRLNGRMATAATLRDLGDLLVDFHGQHENQHLLRPEAHLGFLDASGDAKHTQNRGNVRELFNSWRDSRRRLNELTRNEQARAQRLDMLQFQAGEIDKAKLENDKDAALDEERAKLLNMEKLREAATLCRDFLLGGDEMGAVALARQALKAARDIETMDNSVAEWTTQLQNAIFEIDDAAERARDYLGALDADPRRLDEIEARLSKINRLKRKYGADVEAILSYRAEIEAEIEGLTLSDEQLQTLREEVETKKAAFFQAAAKLSDERKVLAKKFASQVVEQLQTLAMERAQLEVEFQTLEKGSADGTDKIEFLFSANPGQSLRPLAKIASGGEISRVMLALRSVLREREDEEGVAVVVFDEIDSGIGGLTAEKVGEKMSEIARGHQVFCITHLPQIAKRADHHFRVEKQTGDDFTSVAVVPLENEIRVVEMARMMGSESAANIEHARELLNGKVASSKATGNRRQ